MGITVKFASPSGIPMIVTHSAMPVMRCASASSQPNRMMPGILPTVEPAPASGGRTIVRPNGHSAKTAILKAANPNGIVMMR